MFIYWIANQFKFQITSYLNYCQSRILNAYNYNKLKIFLANNYNLSIYPSKHMTSSFINKLFVVLFDLNQPLISIQSINGSISAEILQNISSVMNKSINRLLNSLDEINNITTEFNSTNNDINNVIQLLNFTTTGR